MRNSITTTDHVYVYDRIAPLLRGLRGERLFITGGTGLFGMWLVENLLWAIDQDRLDMEICLLTRSIDAFRSRAPHITHHPAIHCLQGDVRNFPFPDGAYSHIIHAAADASAQLNQQQPELMFSTLVDGTRRVCEFAACHQTVNLLLVSSGAVYGKQPFDCMNIDENYPGGPDPLNPGSAYAEGKRAAEFIGASSTRENSFTAKIARCFAFVGPYLPLDKHFAIGNFLRDALAGQPIRILGDGTPYRSYMYMADLSVWLWTIFLQGENLRPYNVGAEEAVSITETARLVAKVAGSNSPVEIAKEPVPGRPSERYVPSTRRARDELGLQPGFTTEEAIRNTLQWYRQDNLGNFSAADQPGVESND